MRSRRWVLGLGAALLSAVVTVGTGGAAEAVATFSPTKTVGNNCYFAYSATSSTGRTRGVMGCESASGSSSEVVLFNGNGSAAYTRIRTGVLGVPLAFADDGTSYYAVYQAETAANRTTVKLLKRNRSTGRTTTKVLVDRASDYVSVDAAIVARSGKYWAAVSLADEAFRVRTLTRQTLDPALPAVKAVEGWQPALALRGTKRVTMVVSNDMLSSTQSVWRYLPQADGTWKRSTITTDGFRPTVQYSGGVTRIAWLKRVNEFEVYKVVYADNASGSFVRRAVPGPAAWPSSTPFIAVNQGKLTVGWTARNSDSPLKWTRAGVAQRVNGTWTSRTVGHGSTDANLAGLGAWDGKVITVMAGFVNGVPKVTSRRQP